MADPEELLGALPEESHPPEIVLAAVRVFRYRVLAIVALAVALAVVGVVWVNKLAENGRFLVEVGDAQYTGGVLANAKGVGASETVDDITLTVWEAVRSADGRTIYVHLIGWDERGRNLWLDARNFRFGGVPANETALEGGPTTVTGRTLLDLWFAVERSTPGPLTFDAVIEGAGAKVVASVPFEIAMEQGMP
jgi:hypothetical protein